MSKHLRIRAATVCVLFVVFCWCTPIFAADDKNKTALAKDYLIFGFLPIESPVSLFKRFAPFRDYLSTQIAADIRMETAKDFPSFVKRTAERHYDIVFTAPHMALHALDGNNYEIAATFIKPLKSVVVVKEKSKIQNLKNLEGKTIATPPQQAIVTLVGMQYLSGQGIRAARYSTYRSHNAAYAAVLGGEADGAIIANFIAMKAISKNKPLKIVAQSEPFPGIGILVARDMPEALKQHIKKAIWSMKELPNGKNILKRIGQPGYREAKKNQFEILRPYIKAVLP